jgi:hypothetical protein
VTGSSPAAWQIHGLRSWHPMPSNMGIGDGRSARYPINLCQRGRAPWEGGLGWPRGSLKLRDIVQIPRDPRGIVLACGFVAAGAFGIAALLVGDPIGFFFLAAAALGYFFLQTRLVPTTVWLLVAAYGAAGGYAGNPAGWVEASLGLLLAIVALTRQPVMYRGEAAKTPLTATLAGETSAFLEVSPPQSSTSAEVRAPGKPETGLGIRSIGRLRLLGPAGDLAPALEDKSVLAFIWKYLLARYVVGRPQVARESLGDEVSPGISAATQRGRVRKQLYDVRKDIHPDLAVLVRTNRSHVWLDLANASFDVDSLKELCARVRTRGVILDAELANQVQAMLEATGPQEFLAGFEELENRVTQGRGTAGSVVADARALISNERADLARALAEYHDASGRTQAAIPHLKLALDALPERQDLARLLAAAYMRTGQSDQADKVRHTFNLKQE